MPVDLPEWENIIAAGAAEKNDVMLSKIRASIQSEVAPYKSSYVIGVYREALYAPKRGLGRSRAEIFILKYFHTDT